METMIWNPGGAFYEGFWRSISIVFRALRARGVFGRSARSDMPPTWEYSRGGGTPKSDFCSTPQNVAPEAILVDVLITVRLWRPWERCWYILALEVCFVVLGVDFFVFCEVLGSCKSIAMCFAMLWGPPGRVRRVL